MAISEIRAEVPALVPAMSPARYTQRTFGDPGGPRVRSAGGRLRRYRHEPLVHAEGVPLAAGGKEGHVADLYGILSLMLWALVMVVTVKYLCFVMRADHHGEGGIFALLAIVPDRFRTHTSRKGRITGMALLGRHRSFAVIRRRSHHAGNLRCSAPSRGWRSPVRDCAAGAAAHVRHPRGAVLDPTPRDRQRRESSSDR